MPHRQTCRRSVRLANLGHLPARGSWLSTARIPQARATARPSAHHGRAPTALPPAAGHGNGTRGGGHAGHGSFHLEPGECATPARGTKLSVVKLVHVDPAHAGRVAVQAAT